MPQINKNTYSFLKDLEMNNDRDWFAINKGTYESSLSNVKSFLNEVLVDFQQIDNIEKMKVFRIYRDVRFAKDKSPYKTNFGTGFTRATDRLRGGYYIHLQPGETFVGGGFWQPNPADLKRIRQEFEMDDKEIRKIIADPTFLKYFGELKGDELKTAPKGFDKEHPAIDLIRKKNYVVSRAFTDKEVFSSDFKSEIIKTFAATRPWFDYMSEVLTTDVNGVSTFD